MQCLTSQTVYEQCMNLTFAEKKVVFDVSLFRFLAVFVSKLTQIQKMCSSLRTLENKHRAYYKVQKITSSNFGAYFRVLLIFGGAYYRDFTVGRFIQIVELIY